MKVPNNILSGMGGRRNQSVAIFSMILMAIAGALWGLWTKLASPDSVGQSNWPSKEECIRSYGEPCPGCGMG